MTSVSMAATARWLQRTQACQPHTCSLPTHHRPLSTAGRLVACSNRGQPATFAQASSALSSSSPSSFASQWRPLTRRNVFGGRSRRRSGRVRAEAGEGGRDASSSETSSSSTVVKATQGSGSTLVKAAEEKPANWVNPVLLEDEEDISPIQKWLYPSKDELPDDVPMSIWDHLEELRERIFVSVGAVGAAILVCFVFSKELVTFLEAPVYAQGVRFLQLSPGEYFFTTLKVAGYCGLLLGGPVILYEIIAFVVPGLTVSERRFLAPIVFGSSALFYAGIAFSYSVLTPAALNFFLSYAEGVVESLWSIDQYFEFVLVLMFSTGLSFQVPVIQLLLGQTGLVTAEQMLSVWRYVVVGAVIAAAVLTPSTDPLTQCLLAGPLIGLYMGGAYLVKFTEGNNKAA